MTIRQAGPNPTEPALLLPLLLRIEIRITEGVHLLLNCQTIIGQNYTSVGSISWAYKSCQICFTLLWARINFHSNLIIFQADDSITITGKKMAVETVI